MNGKRLMKIPRNEKANISRLENFQKLKNKLDKIQDMVL